MADEANYVFADIPVRASIRSAQRASPEEIVKIAEQMWADVRASGVAATDHAGNDALLNTLQDKYRDFMESFPIVLRWAVQARQFDSDALRKYLLKHASSDLSTREGFLRLQAEYLVLLFRAARSHPSEADVKRYRTMITAQLLDEDRAFVEIQAQVDKDFAARDREVDHDRRVRLYQSLVATRVARETATVKEPPVSRRAEQD